MTNLQTQLDLLHMCFNKLTLDKLVHACNYLSSCKVSLINTNDLPNYKKLTLIGKHVSVMILPIIVDKLLDPFVFSMYITDVNTREQVQLKVSYEHLLEVLVIFNDVISVTQYSSCVYGICGDITVVQN